MSKTKSVKVGDIVIVSPSGQAGTLWNIAEECMVGLRNGDIWYGAMHDIRLPQGPEDLAACPVDIDRFTGKPRT